MDSALRHALRDSDDKLRFVVEHDLLYTSLREQVKAASALRTIADKGNALDRIDVRLGLCYVQRLHPSLTWDELSAELERLEKICPKGTRQRVRTGVIRATALLLKKRDYREAVDCLESLEETVRRSDDHFLYGILSRSLAVGYMIVGEHQRADEAFQNAVATFRRYDCPVSLAYTVNDYAILKKNFGQYLEAEHMLKAAVRILDPLSNNWGRMVAYVNLGTVAFRRGDWAAARRYFERAISLRETFLYGTTKHDESRDALVVTVAETCIEHLLVKQRNFDEAEARLKEIVARSEGRPTLHRVTALAHEFLGELYTETREHQEARRHIDLAIRGAEKVSPESDIMTETLRRLAELQLRQAQYDDGLATARGCVRLCKKIGDRHELGAVLRILGELHTETGNRKKARAAFETAIFTLRSIHECYELMRACLAYGNFLIDEDEEDADIYLLEARQLCQKLELSYFLAMIEVALSRSAASRADYEQARRLLTAAEELANDLQGPDRQQLTRTISRTSGQLNKIVVKTSLESAKQLRAIGKLYEEARFPVDELKPDLAYHVAASVGGDSLFLARRRNRGYHIPLTFNIPVAEAKETVRRFDRDRKAPILGVVGDPRVFEIHGGRTMVVVPGTEDGHVLCVLFSKQTTFSPRQLEFLFASAEAMEQVAADTAQTPPVAEEFLVEEGNGQKVHPRGSFKDILTVDPNMIKLIRLAERASVSNAPILLEGETGVGKELFARAIHENSRRNGRNFVAINAGGMPVNLLESQLFGHVRGAFTDAVVDRVGLIEEANRGTLFLDEVGEMSAELQIKLLRLLENGEYRRLGDNALRTANVRVISATNRDLVREVEGGVFRRDLFYRLGTVKLSIPSLRFRQRDIQLLFRHFLRDCANRNGMADRHFEIDMKAVEALEIYAWPGNVRELHNEVMRIVSLIGGGTAIRFGMLSEAIKEYVRSRNRSDGLLERSVERYERRFILDALFRNDWNRLRTAEEIGVPRTTLLAKMKRLGIAAR